MARQPTSASGLRHGGTACGKTRLRAAVAPSAAESRIDSRSVTVRLKPHPFKAKSKPEFSAGCEAVPFQSGFKLHDDPACYRIAHIGFRMLASTRRVPLATHGSAGDGPQGN